LQESRTLLARAVHDADIFTVRRELAGLKTKALVDMHTDIIPRFRKTDAYSDHLKGSKDSTTRSAAVTAAAAAPFGARRSTIGSSPAAAGGVVVPEDDASTALASASASSAAPPPSMSVSPGHPSLPRGKLSDWTLTKAVRHLSRRRRVLGVSVRVAPSARALDAIRQVVVACKANPLREGFLHKRGGGRRT